MKNITCIIAALLLQACWLKSPEHYQKDSKIFLSNEELEVVNLVLSEGYEDFHLVTSYFPGLISGYSIDTCTDMTLQMFVFAKMDTSYSVTKFNQCGKQKQDTVSLGSLRFFEAHRNTIASENFELDSFIDHTEFLYFFDFRRGKVVMKKGFCWACIDIEPVSLKEKNTELKSYTFFTTLSNDLAGLTMNSECDLNNGIYLAHILFSATANSHTELTLPIEVSGCHVERIHFPSGFPYMPDMISRALGRSGIIKWNENNVRWKLELMAEGRVYEQEGYEVYFSQSEIPVSKVDELVSILVMESPFKSSLQRIFLTKALKEQTIIFQMPEVLLKDVRILAQFRQLRESIQLYFQDLKIVIILSPENNYLDTRVTIE